MTDEDIAKLASQLTESLATKQDISDVKQDIKRLEERLGAKIDELEGKVDVILTYADGINESVEDHEKRLKNIETVPAIAHDLKIKKSH